MSYHIARAGQQLGTFTEEEVIEGLHSGAILPTDELWTEGMDDWQPVEEVIEADEEEPVEQAIEPLVAEAAPEPSPAVAFEEGAETQEVAPHVPAAGIAPAPADPDSEHAEPPMVAARPMVVYRAVAPSLLPGQYGTAGSAIASMGLGILSLATCFITGVPAIICGHVARR